MLSLAAINRLRLTPWLQREEDAACAWDAVLQLRRNALIEAMLGAVILIIVAVLGTLPPGHDENEEANAKPPAGSIALLDHDAREWRRFKIQESRLR
jgi:hypothetical protein